MKKSDQDIVLQPDPEKPKDPVKVRAGRLGGLKTSERFAKGSDSARDRASRGGTTTLARYGRDYYKFLISRRPRGRKIPPEITMVQRATA